MPEVLRTSAGGQATVEAPAGKAGQELSDLPRLHPALVRAIRTKAGAIRPHVNVFVNREDIRHLDAMQTGLRPGDAVIILPPITGG